MGRKNKNKKREKDESKQKRPTKKQKREKFWIEDCQDTSLPPSSPSNVERASLEVLITQCQLFDDYRQIPRPQVQSSDAGVERKADTLVDEYNSGSLDDPKNEIDQKADDGITIKDVADEPQSEKESNVGSDDKKSDERKNKNTKEESNEHSKRDCSDAFISIKRAKSALKHIQHIPNSVENFRPLPNGDCGDGILNPYDKKEVPDKFWSQRRRLFTLFDKGIQLDKESWYSVTPEAIANHISAYLVGNREDAIVLDPFCGCGGNAIAFAKMESVKLVVCVDKDSEKLKMAAANANIYGIPKEKMVFIHDNAGRVLSLYENRKRSSTPANSKITRNEDKGESFKIGGIELLPETIDCVFLSPPWGGMDYAKVGKRNYTLQCIRVDGIDENSEMDGEDILNGAAKALGQDAPLALFLPKNINGVALGRSLLRAGYTCPLVLEKNVLNGKLKTVTAYIGL